MYMLRELIKNMAGYKLVGVNCSLTHIFLEQARACGVDADPWGALHGAPASLQ